MFAVVERSAGIKTDAPPPTSKGPRWKQSEREDSWFKQWAERETENRGRTTLDEELRQTSERIPSLGAG